MAVDKKVNYDVQGGVKNYLGKQKQVKAPLKWQSSPDHPTTELAYITEAEKDLLIKSDLHGSLKGSVNKGPSGIMSLNGFGSTDSSQNVGGGDVSSAETGGGRSGMSQSDANDFRSAAINAGAGQRVNPGFFDSKNTISPKELEMAKNYRNQNNIQGTIAQKAYNATRGGTLGNFIGGGGILGASIRGLGQKLGLGKTYDQPTYDMSNDLNYNYDGEFNDGVEDIFEDNVLTEKTNIVNQLGRDNNSNYKGITSTIPKIIEDLVNENSEVFKSRFLQNRTQEEKEAIEKMINEKFKYDYNSFGLGDMDGS